MEIEFIYFLTVLIAILVSIIAGTVFILNFLKKDSQAKKDIFNHSFYLEFYLKIFSLITFFVSFFAFAKLGAVLLSLSAGPNIAFELNSVYEGFYDNTPSGNEVFKIDGTEYYLEKNSVPDAILASLIFGSFSLLLFLAHRFFILKKFKNLEIVRYYYYVKIAVISITEIIVLPSTLFLIYKFLTFDSSVETYSTTSRSLGEFIFISIFYIFLWIYYFKKLITLQNAKSN